MNPLAVVTLVLVAVGVVLIGLGTWMSLRDWRKEHEGEMDTKAESLGETLDGLAKLVKALEGYPTGQRLIVFGIVVLVIAGLFGGISGL